MLCAMNSRSATPLMRKLAADAEEAPALDDEEEE
jgi:hypothetical protein